MARRNFLESLKKTEGLLPAAIGALGVVYYAVQAHAPAPAPGSPNYVRDTREWTKHVQTGQLLAVVALASGVLFTRLKPKSR
jgi:hypothetical protein